MSWTGSEKHRHRQLPVSCPDRFRGNRRYVTQSDCQKHVSEKSALGGMMLFGRYKGKPLSIVPTDYLAWIVRSVKGRKPLKKIIIAELARRNNQTP